MTTGRITRTHPSPVLGGGHVHPDNLPVDLGVHSGREQCVQVHIRFHNTDGGRKPARLGVHFALPGVASHHQ